MQEYRNTSGSARRWHDVQRPDGTTLELESGARAELDLPEDFEDPHLKPVKTAKSAPETKE